MNSSPKLEMISGYDSTLTSIMLFLGLMFKNENTVLYYFIPIYKSNDAFEVYIIKFLIKNFLKLYINN